MKVRLFSVGLVVMFLCAMLSPSFVFAASNSYSFTMEHRVVDGSENNKFMTLSAGTATISGTHYESSTYQTLLVRIQLIIR